MKESIDLTYNDIQDCLDIFKNHGNDCKVIFINDRRANEEQIETYLKELKE